MVQHADIDHTGIPGTGSGSYLGKPLVVLPKRGLGLPTAGTNSTADLGFMFPLDIPGPMKVRGLTLDITTSAAGSIQWGLFDFSSTLTACVKVAGGSAAPGGTGYRSIAASGAPVDVAAGTYLLILKQPAATVPAIRTEITAGASVLPWNQIFSAYTWDDTPDVTSATWAANQTQLVCYLEGDLDNSGTRLG